MAPTGAAKIGAANFRPNRVKVVSMGAFSQMVSMLMHTSCHF